MVPIRLSDSISMVGRPSLADGRAGEIVLDLRTCLPVRPPAQPQVIPAGSENLVVRALELLRERSDCRLGARVELVKRIPLSSGLGGGSSDAAAALRLANRVWELNWPMERLAELAAELGSDVPFFLTGGAAICRGRGELVERVAGMRPLHVVIVKPPNDLSTAEVYRAHDSISATPHRHDASGGLSRTIPSLAIDTRAYPGQWMLNRLQAAAASLSPWIERLRAIFDRLDFIGHQLSGSGSAYFGVCRHAQHARRLATILRSQQLGLVYATRSCA